LEREVVDTREIIVRWLQKANEELETGEQMLFPADTKQDQKEKKKLFLRELRILAKVDPVAASQMRIVGKFEDHRFWIVVERVAFSPFIAFKKGKSGTVERVTMEDDSEKLRRLSLMREDGYTLEDIEEMEGGLTEEDREFLKRERR